MNDMLQTGYGGAVHAVDRNRVLRNTYWLLALSLIPTVAGTWVGVVTGFNFFGQTPMMSFLAFMAVAFGFFFAIEKNKDSGLGVVLLLAFTFFMGLMLSRLVGMMLKDYSNAPQLIAMAFGGTALVFATMAGLATTIKRDLSGLGKWLTAGAILLIVGIVANIWLQMPALMLTILVLAIAIFSAFMLFDIKRIVDGGETNYVTATLAVYLDIYNVFQSLLSLLGIFGGERD